MTGFRKAAGRIAAVAIVTSIFYALLWLIFNDVDSLADRERLSENDAAQSAVIDQLQNDLATEQATSLALADQLARFGLVPEVEPGPTIVNQSTPLSLIQTLIDAGLNARCGGLDCTGEPGPPAPPAKDGTDGTDGRNGTDGQTPSNELLISLIQPLIPPPATNGVDGVGVLAITCTSPTPFPVSFDFALTNGTTQTVTCPTVLEPETPTDPPPLEETP